MLKLKFQIFLQLGGEFDNSDHLGVTLRFLIFSLAMLIFLYDVLILNVKVKSLMLKTFMKF